MLLAVEQNGYAYSELTDEFKQVAMAAVRKSGYHLSRLNAKFKKDRERSSWPCQTQLMPFNTLTTS